MECALSRIKREANSNIPSLRQFIRNTLGEQAALGIGVLCAAGMSAQAADNEVSRNSGTTNNSVLVEGARIGDYRQEASSVSKLTEALRDTS